MSAPANRGAAPENKEGTHLICIRFRVLHPLTGTQERERTEPKKRVLTGVTCVPLSQSHVTREGHM